MRSAFLAGTLVVTSACASNPASNAHVDDPGRASGSVPFSPTVARAPRPPSWIPFDSADHDAKLQQRVGTDDDEWTDVCLPPCVALVNPGTRLRVDRVGIVASEPFAAPAGVHTVRANTARSWPLRVGVPLVAAGPPVMLFSALLPAMTDCHPGNWNAPCDKTARTAARGVVVGAVMTVTGLAMLVASRTTHVEIDGGPAQSVAGLRVSPRGIEF